MTIALGIICDTGIVVAADTEESIPGLMKREQEKIQVLLTRYGATLYPPGGVADVTIRFHSDVRSPKTNPPETDIAVAGAGSSGYIDALIPRLTSVFQQNEWVTDDIELRTRTEIVIRRFYKEHIIPFAAYPPGERPEVEMLLAYQRAGIRRILVSEKTAVRSVQQGEVVAVGAGAFFAKMLLRPFHLSRGLDLRTAQLLAAYTVFRVKEFIDGCGKYTSMAMIPYSEPLSPDQVSGLEALFLEQARVEAKTLARIFRHPKDSIVDAKAMVASYDQLRSRCDDILTPSEPLESPKGRSAPQGSKRGRQRRLSSQE